MLSAYDQAVQDIIAVGKRLDVRGLTPATAGNFSVKLPNGRIAITVSGKHKGRLVKEDIMMVDKGAKALEDKKPSAETWLHAHLYGLYPDMNAVLHGHSVAGVALTDDPKIQQLILENYEILKIFPGINTHDTSITIPVLDNSQDMSVISAELDKRLTKIGRIHAYLLRGHGFYVWGSTIAEAEYAAEALEHLLQCELEIQKLGAPK